MSEHNKQRRSPELIARELTENIRYTVTAVSAGLAALRESNIAEQFKGNIPKCVELDAVPLGLWELFTTEIDREEQEKLFRGLVVICMLYSKEADRVNGDILEEAIRIINGGDNND
jgi:hypothetical protein